MRTSVQNKSCFIMLLMMVLLLNGIVCNAKSITINTSAGKLQHETTPIKDSHLVTSKNIINGKVVSGNTEDYPSYGEEFVEQIKTSYGDINIFRVSNDGNGCPVLYYAITTSKTGNYYKSQSFGNCSEVEKYRKVMQGDVLILKMKNLMKVSEDMIFEIHKNKIVERSTKINQKKK